MQQNPIQALVSRAEYSAKGPNGSIYVDRDLVISDLEAELDGDIRKAMAGRQHFVPSYQGLSGSRKETLESAEGAIQDALNFTGPVLALMHALYSSTCPMVGALRDEIAKQYVASNTDGLAEARGY